MKRSLYILVVILLLASLPIAAQNLLKKSNTGPFVLGKIDKVESAQLSETRYLNIYLPDDYDTNTNANYPVIYLLDGSANEDFVHICGLVQFLNMIEAMPPTIVVGIANVDRKRDFTHPATVAGDLKLLPTSGGSEKFMQFIEKDLQPYINTHYRVNGRKTIIGQSLGGLFATEVLLKRPQLFTDYIIVSPSLWWNEASLLHRAQALLANNLNSHATVYVSAGNEGKEMGDEVNELVKLLRKNPLKITLTYMPLPEETHLTILHNSVYKAFEILNKKH